MPDFVDTNTDGEQIKSTAADVEQAIGDIKSALSKIGGYISELESYWKGPAHDQFQNIHNKDKAGFDKFISDCSSLNNVLKSSGDCYQKADDTVLALIKQIKVPALGGAW